MPALRTPKARLLFLGLIPIVLLGLALLVALSVTYATLGKPNLVYLSLNLVSGCQNQKCDLALAPKSLLEPHTMDRYAQITRLINNASWHWAIHLGPATLHSEFYYDVPNYEVLVHGGYVDVVGPSVGLSYTTPNPASSIQTNPFFTLDNRGR